MLSTLGVDRDDARKLRKRFDRFGSVDYADFCRFVEADVDGLRFAASKIADKLAEQQRKGLDVSAAVPDGRFRRPWHRARSTRLPGRSRALDLGDSPGCGHGNSRLRSRSRCRGDPDAVDYREFLKFVRDAGCIWSRRGRRRRLGHVGCLLSPAYDGFYGGGSSDDEDDRPRRRNPPRSPVTRQRRTLFQGDSARSTAWRGDAFSFPFLWGKVVCNGAFACALQSAAGLLRPSCCVPRRRLRVPSVRARV